MQYRRKQIVKVVLQQNDIDVTLTNKAGKTALDVAKDKEYDDIIARFMHNDDNYFAAQACDQDDDDKRDVQGLKGLELTLILGVILCFVASFCVGINKSKS